MLYCAKIGCAITGGASATIAAGASIDSVLEAAGREKVFIPMMGSLYKSVFGELPKDAQDRITTMVTNTEPKPDNNVSDMVKKYHAMNGNERLEFLAEINQELVNKK